MHPYHGKDVGLDDLQGSFSIQTILRFYDAISFQEKERDFSFLLVSNTLSLVITVKAVLLIMLLKLKNIELGTS